MLGVHVRAGAQMDLRGAAVEAAQTAGGQEVVKMSVVGVAEEGLGVSADDLGIEVRDDGDLIVAADSGAYGADRVVGEGGHEVAGALTRAGPELPGGRILNGNQTRDLLKPPHGLLVNLGGDGRGREGRGQNGDPIPGPGLGRREKGIGIHEPRLLASLRRLARFTAHLPKREGGLMLVIGRIRCAYCESPHLRSDLGQAFIPGEEKRGAHAHRGRENERISPPQLKLLSQFAGPTSKHLVSVDHHE